MKLPISKLVNNTGQIEGLPANPRTINKDDYQKLLKSLRDDPDFLNHKPLHVYEHNGKYIVLGGNQRLKALKELGHKDVPVTIYDPETPVEVLKRRIIVDNSTFGDYDMDMLANEWDSEPLDDWGVDLPEDWLKQDGEIEEDEAPEVSDDPPVSKLGEVYQLGRHRLMCGSATEESDVAKLMDGNKADMVFTDPPYGMNLDTDYTKMGSGGNKYDKVIADDEQFDASQILETFSYCKEIFLWGADYYVETLLREYPNLGSWVIWDKYSDDDRKGLLDGKFGSAFETCWSKTPHKRELARVLVKTNYTSVGDETRVHPTQKPAELAMWFFSRWGNKGDNVIDLFGGSGSTLIACEQTYRTCYMMELDEKYVDVIRKRYHKFVNGTEEGWEDATPAI